MHCHELLSRVRRKQHHASRSSRQRHGRRISHQTAAATPAAAIAEISATSACSADSSAKTASASTDEPRRRSRPINRRPRTAADGRCQFHFDLQSYGCTRASGLSAFNETVCVDHHRTPEQKEAADSRAKTRRRKHNTAGAAWAPPSVPSAPLALQLLACYCCKRVCGSAALVRDAGAQRKKRRSRAVEIELRRRGRKTRNNQEDDEVRRRTEQVHQSKVHEGVLVKEIEAAPHGGARGVCSSLSGGKAV